MRKLFKSICLMVNLSVLKEMKLKIHEVCFYKLESWGALAFVNSVNVSAFVLSS